MRPFFPNTFTIKGSDVKGGWSVCLRIIHHDSWVLAVAVSPDGRRIVSGSYDKTLRIWDAETGAAFSEPLIGHSDRVRSVAFSHDSRRIVSGSDDGTLRIWDLGIHISSLEQLVSSPLIT